MSVTLNPESKKPVSRKNTDLWEPDYPYSTKNVIYDENGNPLGVIQQNNDFEEAMHKRFVEKSEMKETNQDLQKYNELEEENDEENPKDQ